MSRGTGILKGRRGARKPNKTEIISEQRDVISNLLRIVNHQRGVIESLKGVQ